MCSPAIDCPFCADIETCARVAHAFPTQAEQAAEKPGPKPKVVKRVHAPVLAGMRECSVPGCPDLNASGSSYCPAHRYEKFKAWRKAKKGSRYA